jgi:uncharacterized protein YyaL (SSP411 family)
MQTILRSMICVAVFLGLGQYAGGDSAIAEETPKATVPSQDSGGHAYTNRLIHSNDPYLLLHAHNPVDWYPWGPEALARAKRENKPIFLSIGYSTCYWCHVAERTIYSNPEIAKLMNQWFINIKVDREQRPDLDEIYMLVTNIMTGQGGWPNNVFLTPDLKPIFAGSYFPPGDDALGRPGFPTVLRTIHEAWTAHRQDVIASADRVFKVMQQARQEKPDTADIPLVPAAWLKQAREAWSRRFDSEYGGFPSGDREMKFPQEPVLAMFLADYRISHNPEDLEVLTHTLNAMAFGGIYDHLGGGFHRYSTEKTWSIPHFEKMLYDNAQLLTIYAEAYQLTQDPLYRYTAENVREYLTRQMTAPEGGFFTAEDAEVRGEEGASYLWTRKEITSTLGAEAAQRFFKVYALTTMPAQSAETALNDTERGVLRVDVSMMKRGRKVDSATIKRLSDLAPLRQKLLAARDRRPQPLRDEKIIVALNGLAIEAFVRSGKVFQRPEDIALARRVAERIWTLAYDPKSGRLKHEIFRGRAQIDGYLDDYALLGRAMLSLHVATGETVWRNRAAFLADTILKKFQRRDGSLATAVGDKGLPISPRDSGDNVYPSGTSAAIDLFQRLAEASGKALYATAAERALRRLSRRVQQDPEAWPVLVAAVNVHPARQAMNSAERMVESGSAANAPASSRDASKKLSSLSTASHVHITAEIRDAGDQDRIVLTLHVDKGYHINANPASLDYLIPTSVVFEELTPAKIIYPRPVRIRPEFAREGLNVYEGEVSIVAVVQREALNKRKTLRATVTAQACTDQVCLPPAKLPVVVQVSANK